MGYGQGKLDNEYARALLAIDASKTVWMAIAFSLASRILEGEAESDPSKAADLCFAEWAALHSNGIVPQKPKRDRDRSGRFFSASESDTGARG
jgi:hypothetical protein